MTSEPIIVREHEVTITRSTTKEWTYEELLELFDDNANLVRPLVLRCQEHEAEIERLRAGLQRILDLPTAMAVPDIQWTAGYWAACRLYTLLAQDTLDETGRTVEEILLTKEVRDDE